MENINFLDDSNQIERWEEIKSKFSSLFDFKAGFDPNQPRNPDGTWGNGGGSWHKVDVEKTVKMHHENGGSTIDPLTGKDMAFTPGAYSVVINLDRTWNPEKIGENLTKENMEAFLERNKDLFEAGGKLFGSWYGADPGQPEELWLDVATIVYNREKAIELAKENNQIAIFDLENMEVIETGGSGKYNIFIMNVKGNKTEEEKKRAWEAWANYMKRIHPSKPKTGEKK